MAYMSQSYGYIYLKLRFSHIERKFQSPLGIYGAMYTFLVSLLGVISIICCQDDNQFAFIVIVCATAILSFFYFLFIQQHQSFSEEEKQRLFFLHVDNFQTAKAQEKLQQKGRFANSLSMRGFSTRLFLRNTNKIPSENHTVAQAFGGNENVEVANQPLTVDNVQDRAQDDFYVLQ
eukprot:gene2413-2897_t